MKSQKKTTKTPTKPLLILRFLLITEVRITNGELDIQTTSAKERQTLTVYILTTSGVQTSKKGKCLKIISTYYLRNN